MSHFRNTVNPLLSSPGGLFFPSTFEAGGGGETGEMHQREQGFSRTDFWLPGAVLLFSKNKKMVTILHRELEHKGEKFQHVKLEVMRAKTTDVFFLFSPPLPRGFYFYARAKEEILKGSS